nr:splicing factor [Tanacetum cinerariifolium]
MLIADQVFIVNLHHDGIFIPSPLRYLQGDLKQITDIDFEGMSFDVFHDIIKPLVHGIVYRVGYENKWFVDLYVKHFDYDVMDFINEEANGVLSDGSSDEYYSSDEIKEFDDAQKGVTYQKHDPTIPYNNMTPVLGMRSVEGGRCAESFKSAKSAPKSSKKGAKSTKSAGKPAKSVGQCKRAKQKAHYNHERGVIEQYGSEGPSVQHAPSIPASDNATKKKRKRTRIEPNVPFRIYYKNKGRSERIRNMKEKKFKFDAQSTRSTAKKAFDVSP